MHWIIYHVVKLPETDYQQVRYTSITKYLEETIYCPDGQVSAAIVAGYLRDLNVPYTSFRDAYRNKKDYEPLPNFNQYPFKEGDTLWIVDFSYPKIWLEYWEASGIMVDIYDHHAAKFGDLQGFKGAVLNDKECGATLVWDSLFDKSDQPEILRHIKTRDIGLDGYYDGEYLYSETVNEGLGKLRHDCLYFSDLVDLIWEVFDNATTIDELYELGKPEIEKREIIIKGILEPRNHQIVPFAGHKAVSVFVRSHEARYHSIIGNRIAAMYPDCKMCVMRFEDGSRSLRSTKRSGFDVSEVARLYGGNGHYRAAGIPPNSNISGT